MCDRVRHLHSSFRPQYEPLAKPNEPFHSFSFSSSQSCARLQLRMRICLRLNLLVRGVDGKLMLLQC